jgi:hypothetical protein
MNLESLAADATHATIRGRGGQVGQAISMLVPASPSCPPASGKGGQIAKGRCWYEYSSPVVPQLCHPACEVKPQE